MGSFHNLVEIDDELRGLLIDYQYIPITLIDDLKLKFKGTKTAELLSCKCFIPALGNAEAKSLNQAYSLISEKFEIKRMSHTGNVFTKIFFKKRESDSPSDYVPLSALRNKKEAEYEDKYLVQKNG